MSASGELPRCLESLRCVRGLGHIIVLVIAEPAIENKAASKIRAVAEQFPDLNIAVVGSPEMALVRQRMEQLNIGLRNEVGLAGYGAMRNLGLLLAGALDFDSVVFVDDDVVIDDPAFLEKAMYGLGKLTRSGVPILAKSGFYLNKEGEYLSSRSTKWYNRYWDQATAFNKWISKAMKGPRLSPLEPCVRWLFGASSRGISSRVVRPVDRPRGRFGLHARFAHVRQRYLVRQHVVHASPSARNQA